MLIYLLVECAKMNFCGWIAAIVLQAAVASMATMSLDCVSIAIVCSLITNIIGPQRI